MKYTHDELQHMAARWVEMRDDINGSYTSTKAGEMLTTLAARTGMTRSEAEVLIRFMAQGVFL